jgi:PRC-barrel domain protein
MIRMLMTGTAIVAVLTAGALAQSSSSSMESSAMDSSSMSSSAMDTSSSMDMSSMDSSAMDSSAMSSQMSTASSIESSMLSSEEPSSSMATDMTTTTRKPVEILSGYTQVDSDRLATKIIGSPVYDGTGTDANNLGKITDLVLADNGQVAAVVLGVGGFLGLGEKQVAVDYAALKWTVAADNTERFVLQTTKDELTNAPDFKTVDDQPSSGAPVSSDLMSSSSAAQ